MFNAVKLVKGILNVKFVRSRYLIKTDSSELGEIVIKGYAKQGFFESLLNRFFGNIIYVCSDPTSFVDQYYWVDTGVHVEIGDLCIENVSSLRRVKCNEGNV